MSLDPGAALAFHSTIALATLGAFGSMLKFMVKDKLTEIKESLQQLRNESSDQGDRLRLLELDFVELKANLRARGCIGASEPPPPHERRVSDHDGWRC